MIHAIRKFAREIHRRSVWQVMGVYLLVAWITLQGVTIATVRLGLPEWTPTLSLVLAIVVGAMVAVTALVQGIPWLRIEDVVDPNELEGLTPEQVHRNPEAHPLYRTRLFTWTNAILCGVTSLALVVTSVVAYLTMWALGIGPVGSLLAQGVIQEGETVLVVDFDNRTDAIDLADEVTEAFRADISESELVDVIQGAELAAVRERLGLGPTASLNAAVAERLARDGAVGVLLQGAVARAGNGYRVEVSIVVPAAPTVIRFEEIAESTDDLVPVIDILSERVRAKLGESLRVIRADTPLDQLIDEGSFD